MINRTGRYMGVLSLGIVAGCAFGQVAGYEVIDLGTLPSPADPKSDAWAINDRHEIVGWAIDSFYQTHATIWLYCPNYGLAAGQWHDLTDMAGETDFGEAYDINMSGLVVGRQTVSTSGWAPRGYIWDVASSPLVTTELDTLVGGATTEGFAAAINDASPAIVVGFAQASGSCGFSPRYEAFSYQYGDPPTTLTALGANSGNFFSMASGVNNASTPRAAGRSTSEQCLITSCQNDQTAVDWAISASPTLTTLPDNGAAYGAQAWGINDAGHTVGLAITATSPCVAHAAFWATSSSSPVDLGSIGISSFIASRAFRVNEAGASGEVTVVGGDTDNALAYRWYRDGTGTWSGADLNSLISPLCGWVLSEAHDVSSDGWIVGGGWIAQPAGGSEYHGFLLKPITCLGDLDGSCTVNGADLGILLGAWGCTSPCPACRADLNRDGLINGADLGIILGAWGASCECWSCPSGNRSNVAQESESDSVLAEGLAILGYGSVAEFNASLRYQTDGERAQVLDWLLVYLTARN